MNRLPHRRATELGRGLGALAILGVLLAGVPAGLLALNGPPFPATAPTWTQITTALTSPDTDNRLFLSAVALLGWTAWAMFVTALLTETIGYLAGRSARLPLPVRPAQRLARDLITMAALIFTTATALTSNTATAAIATASTPPASASTPSSASPAPTPADQEPAGQPATPSPRNRIARLVRKGDTLWSIARRYYGTGTLYPAIFSASKNLDQPSGVPPLTRPDDIHPGQRLRLPHLHDPHRPPAPPLRPPRPARPYPPHVRGDATAAPPTRAPSSAPPSTISPSPRSPQPIRRPSPASERPPASPSAPTAPHPAPPAPQRDRTPTSITLPSGSWIGFGLAAALSLAVAATRLHRRRRPQRSQDGPATPPTPKAVAHARKAFLDTYVGRDQPVPTDTDLLARDRHTPLPNRLNLGIRNNQPVSLPLAGLHLGLTGDTAPAVRAIATTLLANAHRDRAALLIPHHNAQALFPGVDLTALALPGLTLTSTLNAAIAHLEAELIHRARLLEATDQPDLDALRTSDPAEPLPHLLLIATADQSSTSHLHAVLNLGHRYDIGGLFLGPAPAGTTIHLDADATISSAQGPSTIPLTGTQMFHLTAQDAAAMLHTLHTAASASAPETTTAEASPTASSTGHPPADSTPARTDEPAPIHSGSAELVSPPRPSQPDQSRLVELQLLGPIRLHTENGPITTGLRRSARDLLAYLALHPNGITRDNAIEALWPDHEPDSATSTFNTAISNIRKVLRNATQLREPQFVIHTTGRYRLDADLIDTDLWRLTTILNQTRHTTTDTERLEALHTITDLLHTADFAADLTYIWAETHREHLRRTAIDTLTRLADHLQHHHPEHALTALEHAIHHDPYAEPLYRTLMTLQAQLGHPNAANRTYQLLTRRLNGLDTEPDNRTHQLHTEIQRPPKR